MIAKYIRMILVLMFFMCGAFASNAEVASTAKVTVMVIDEEGKPVEGAEIRMCLKGGCLKKEAIKGLTDKDGIYIISGPSPDGVTGGTAEKTGYYYTTFSKSFVISNFGIWQPWNKEIKVVLRPKIKPVPMYVRDRSIKVPVIGKVIGFDLIKFDWVIPYGLGTVADFLVLLDSHFDNTGDKDYSNLTLTFSNKFDGIQSFELDMGGDFGVGSAFRTPRFAPETEYQDKLITRYDPYAPGAHVYRTKDTFHFFRVRSEVDENGKLKRAMYGKMKGDLEAKPTRDGLAIIHIYYALNPDYTRNMECDDQRNLFSPLPSGEMPSKAP